jgi:hypothetical protein
MNRGVPLPLSEVLKRAGLAGPGVTAIESIQNASVQWQLIEDYRPIAESLESRLTLGDPRRALGAVAHGPANDSWPARSSR